MKSDELLLPAATWVSLQSIMLSEKNPDTKGHFMQESIDMKCPERANLQRQKLDDRMPGCAGPIGDLLLMGTRTLFVVLAVFHN